MSHQQHHHHNQRQSMYTVNESLDREDNTPIQRPYSEEGNAPSNDNHHQHQQHNNTQQQEEEEQDEEQQKQQQEEEGNQKRYQTSTETPLSTSLFFSSKAKAKNSVSPMNSNTNTTNHYKNASQTKEPKKVVTVRTQASIGISSLSSSKNFENQLQNLAKISSNGQIDEMDKMRASATQRSISSSAVSYSIVSKNQHKKRVSFSKLVAMIPLPVKLFFIVILSIISLVVFGAILVNDSAKGVLEAQSIKKLTTFSTNIAQIIHELQKERGSSSLYLGGKGKKFVNELAAQRNATNLALSKWNETRAAIGEFFELLIEKDSITWNQTYTVIDAIENTYLSVLPSHRVKITNLQFPVAKPALDFFTNCIKNMIDVVSVLAALAEDRKFLVMTNIYTLLMVMKESLGQRRAVGSNAVAAGAFTNDLYINFLYLKSRYDTMYMVIDAKSRNRDSIGYFTQLSGYVKSNAVIDMMESYMLASPFNLTKAQSVYSAENWFWNVTAKIDELKVVEDNIRDGIFSNSVTIETSSKDALIGYCVGGCCVVIASVILALIFSRTIQDLLRLHNETVHKFVPKEFMSIVQKDSVMDLNHGDYFEMELDVLFADIRGYTSICEKMSPDETFEFLNNYLSMVGPVVREHGGYIDKYLGDGILALFLTPGQSVLAAMELQRRLLEFNKSKKYPTVRVGVGIARGKCAVGLIGEDQRVDPTIIGDTVNLAARLESLTKHYRVDIMVTREVIESSPLLSDSKYRNIGKIAVVGRQQACTIFEVLTESPSFGSVESKKKHKDKFETSMAMMYEKDSFNPIQALEYLKQIQEVDSQDYLVQMRIAKLEEILSATCMWSFEDRLDFK